MDKGFRSPTRVTSGYHSHPSRSTHAMYSPKPYYSNQQYDNDNHDSRRQYSDDEHQTRNANEIAANTSLPLYDEYPADQPFINDNYRRDPNKVVKAFPESNRQAVMSALRGLQDKIRQLELERSAAEDNLRTLADETSRFRDILHTEPDVSYGSQVAASANLTQQNHDVQERLAGAEQRCQLLERQLDHMRRMVHTAESERTRAEQRTELIERRRHDDDDIRQRLDKIAELEREHLKLTATQTMAESKIRNLEGRLKEERHHRKIIQDKAAELETAAETNRILLAAQTTSNGYRKPKKTKKKGGKKRSTSSTVAKHCGRSARGQPVTSREQTQHYKLNLAEIPFVAGKSTTPSHSLPANFQEVLSLMKTHNTILCKSPRQHAHGGNVALWGNQRRRGSSSSSGISTSSETDNMADLLTQLQDEFGQMSFEHQELSRQIAAAVTDRRLREDLERELDTLVTRMEAKGQQIARLHKHQHQLCERRQRKKRPQSAMAHLGGPATEVNGEVEVTTTIRTKGKNIGSVVVKPVPGGNKAQASLNLLKDLKKIQTTLRKDDISWED